MRAHGHLVTGDELTPVYCAVGNFVVGCGVIELQTYLWIEGFSPAEKGKWRKQGKGFHTRKCRVIEVVDALPIADIYKAGAKGIWADASKVMEFRNVITHNPILFRYDGPGSNATESMRIPSIAEYADGDFPDFTITDLNEQIQKAADVNQRLENYRHVIAATLGVELKIEYRYGDQPGK